MLKSNVTRDTPELHVYELWLNRLIQEGNWIYERKRQFNQLNFFAMLAVGSIGYIYFGTIEFTPQALAFFAGLALAISTSMSLRAFHQLKIDADGRHWQRVFVLKLAQLEECLFHAPDTGLAATIERIDGAPTRPDGEALVSLVRAASEPPVAAASGAGSKRQDSDNLDLMRLLSKYLVAVWLIVALGALYFLALEVCSIISGA